MENFAEIFTNNQAKNINKISDEIGKKFETVTTNSSINKKVVRQAGESHPPSDNELTLNGGSDLDKQIGRLVDTTKNVILLLMMMVLNLGRVMRMTSSRILVTILVQWKKQVHQ